MCKIRRASYEYFRCADDDRRTLPVPVRHGSDGAGAGAPGRRAAADAAGQNDRPGHDRLSDGYGHYRRDPKLVGHHRDGGGLRQLRPDDAAAGHQRYHGRQRGYHRDGVAAESGGHQQRQCVDRSAQAHLLYAGAGAGGHHSLYVLQERQEKGYRRDPAGLRHADVRHGHHERRGGGAEGRSRLRPAVRRL